MVGKWWVDYAAQSVIHALVAALAIEALLQIWHARAPDDRLALRLLGLGQPLLRQGEVQGRSAASTDFCRYGHVRVP